ncbi:macrophage metalloelastase-like [Hydractinia symbiolongicarpus]|uniref:macrophage metalloelastase-like n=1 Tax=Hydractinia symbiolongicarpus TaxID=13093 RepID=UPI0025500D71|nr:macrophage metalloelastase-like [Hydractinia symbiolongicarpus]
MKFNILLVLYCFYQVEAKSVHNTHLASNKSNKIPKCGVKSEPTRQKRYVLQNTIWKKSILTWRVDRYTKDLSQQRVRKIIRRAFRKWAVWIPVRFLEKKYGPVDISIQFVIENHEPCNFPFDGRDGDIAHAYYPYQGQDIAGDIHFDDDEMFTDKSFYGRSLAWTALHEIGHSLGLKHSHVWGAVMSPYYHSFYHPNVRLSLSTDDIMGIQSLYGDPLSHGNQKYTSINSVLNIWNKEKNYNHKYLNLL